MRNTILLFLSLFLWSCKNETPVNTLPSEVPVDLTPSIMSSKKFPVRAGDCFSSDSIPGYGLVLYQILDFDGKEEYAFTAIKLDTTEKNIDRYRYGKINIGKYNNGISGNEKIEGLFTFSFLSDTDFAPVFRHLKKEGNIQIRKEFLNASGGTAVSSLDEFKTHFRFFDTGYKPEVSEHQKFLEFIGVSNRLAGVQEIIKD